VLLLLLNRGGPVVLRPLIHAVIGAVAGSVTVYVANSVNVSVEVLLASTKDGGVLATRVWPVLVLVVAIVVLISAIGVSIGIALTVFIVRSYTTTPRAR